MSYTCGVCLEVLLALFCLFLALAPEVCLSIPEEIIVMCLVCVFMHTCASLMIKFNILRLIKDYFFQYLENYLRKK